MRAQLCDAGLEPYCLFPKRISRTQLLENNSAIQMLENFLFSLNSISATWQIPSSTTWAMDMILAFVCGLGLFLLLIPYLQSKPPSPPVGKKKKLRKVRNL
jgi:hypothetical protein